MSTCVNIAALLAFLLISGCSASLERITKAPARRQVPTVRICLAEDSDRVLVRALGEHAICTEGAQVEHINGDATIRIVPSGSKLVQVFVNDEAKGRIDEVTIEPRGEDARFMINGSAYHDTIRILSNPNGSLSVVNYTNVETYVRGTVSNEIGKKRSPEEYEAVKAQAVAVRSRALARLKTRSRDQFDLYADTRDQMYTGSSAETQLTNKAVDETRGIVLSYEDEIVDCFYHSSCGGRTESAQNVWKGSQGFPYLQSMSDGEGKPFCQPSPDFQWQERWTRSELEMSIKRNLSASNPAYSHVALSSNTHLENVEITKRFQSGRVNELRILLVDKRKSLEFTVYGDKVRWLLRRPPDGKRILKSSLFSLSLKRDKNNSIQSVTANGKGNGHGAGMCQWGAIGRARLGETYGEILTHYFSGTKVVKAY
jgi:stage II sporulation protein D